MKAEIKKLQERLEALADTNKINEYTNDLIDLARQKQAIADKENDLSRLIRQQKIILS